MRKCTKCEQQKEIDKFSIGKTWCKCCSNEYARIYRENNKNLIKEKYHTWYNSDGKINRKAYGLKMKDATREYERNRYHSDPEYRIRKVLRTRFIKTIKGQKSSRSMFTYISMDINSFKKWIEFQWADEMSWGNLWSFMGDRSCSSV
jgi:hypothetical protein